MGLLLMIGTIIPVWIAMVQIRPFKLSRNPPNLSIARHSIRRHVRWHGFLSAHLLTLGTS